MWLGLRRERPDFGVDYQVMDLGPNPLYVVPDDEEWSYADGAPFNPGADFGMGVTSFTTYPCVHLRASSAFAARVTGCQGKSHPFVCRWAGADCPPGFSHRGALSDGRTCHGLGATPSGAAGGMCAPAPADPAADDLSRPSVPVGAAHAEAAARELAAGSPHSNGWLGLAILPNRSLAELYDRGGPGDPFPLAGGDTQDFLPPDALADTHREDSYLRRFNEEDLATLGEYERGCVAVAANGLLRNRYDGDCDVAGQPVCEHRGERERERERAQPISLA